MVPAASAQGGAPGGGGGGGGVGVTPTDRGSCGCADNRSSTVINAVSAFQGHNLVVTATDDATGNVLGAGSWFSRQDCLFCGGA